MAEIKEPNKVSEEEKELLTVLNIHKAVLCQWLISQNLDTVILEKYRVSPPIIPFPQLDLVKQNDNHGLYGFKLPFTVICKDSDIKYVVVKIGKSVDQGLPKRIAQELGEVRLCTDLPAIKVPGYTKAETPTKLSQKIGVQFAYDDVMFILKGHSDQETAVIENHGHRMTTWVLDGPHLKTRSFLKYEGEGSTTLKAEVWKDYMCERKPGSDKKQTKTSFNIGPSDMILIELQRFQDIRQCWIGGGCSIEYLNSAQSKVHGNFTISRWAPDKNQVSEIPLEFKINQ